MNISPYFSASLRQRVNEDMTMRRLAVKTQISYIRGINKLCEHLKHPVETTTQEELRGFQLFMVNHGASGITVNATLTALKFLFQITLDKPELIARICQVTVARKLPVVLSLEEAKRFMSCATHPKCQASAAKRWLAARQTELLPVDYYHAVFILPQPISELAYYNKSVMYGLLLKAAAKTLLTIGTDTKHLGARLGVTFVLHTWGSAMIHHPHVHGIIPGGGLCQASVCWATSGIGLFISLYPSSRYRELSIGCSG